MSGLPHGVLSIRMELDTAWLRLQFRTRERTKDLRLDPSTPRQNMCSVQ